MTRAGFNVPGGFVVTAAAYQAFVAANQLQRKIVSLAKPAVEDGRVSFEKASDAIQALFAERDLSAEITAGISQAYASLDGAAVAVRSSANAEDLPELSFAGQQETYLNVQGEPRRSSRRYATAGRPSGRRKPSAIRIRTASTTARWPWRWSSRSWCLPKYRESSSPPTRPPGSARRLSSTPASVLGEAVVSGQVTPDTYTVDKATLNAKDTIIGPKAQQIVADGGQGTRLADVDEASRAQSSLTDDMLRQLSNTAIDIERLYDGVPQDIEWAIVDTDLYLLQSRPITKVPVQPIEVTWEPPPPARILYRRQIVENMPDPICPLFEELYLTEGLEAPRKGKPSIMPGGGPHFVTCNGYAYNRADHPGNQIDPNSSEEDLKAAFKRTIDAIWESRGDQSAEEQYDLALFRSELSPAEQAGFDAVAAAYEGDNLAHDLTLQPSDNPTYVANNKTQDNDARWLTWQEEARPPPGGHRREVAQAAPRYRHRRGTPSRHPRDGNRGGDLLDGQYQPHLRDRQVHRRSAAVLPTRESAGRSLHQRPVPHRLRVQDVAGQRNPVRDCAARSRERGAHLPRRRDAHEVPAAPRLQEHAEGGPVLKALNDYFDVYGHQGYSLDFIEPTQAEDPSATFATLKSMVQNADYDPKDQEVRATAVREAKFKEVSEKLSGLTYWQFRYRLWFGRRYNHIREETAFYFGYTWSVLRPMAFELGRRLVDAGTFLDPEDTFFMVTAELKRAIEARKAGAGIPELGKLAAERRELREARKLLHPPGTIPEEASNIPSVRFKETQIRNDPSGDALNGFAVSSGKVTAPASVILSQNDFDRMEPGTILVAPNTTPAWTQLFAHAVGLVTDMGSILAHGSIVAREYGIPAVLGVGNGTVRIRHGQSITIDGDAGSVTLHEDG